MRKLISYPLTAAAPVWPGNPLIELEQFSEIRQEEGSNTYRITLHNHCGTHFDAPLHFNSRGAAIAALPLERFFYECPLLLDLPKGPGEKIEAGDLAPHQERIRACDLLMLRTGFALLRERDPALYSENGPGVSSGAAKYLMDTFTNIKAVALDFISLASYSDVPDGQLAHHYLLGRHHPHFICIIEDVNLRELPPEGPCRAGALPLMIEGVDSGPVTMWAEWE